jgi:hypothetical protein
MNFDEKYYEGEVLKTFKFVVYLPIVVYFVHRGILIIVPLVLAIQFS